MTLENARVLHKDLLAVGRTNAAKDIERRYPELKEASMDPQAEPPKPKTKNKEEKINGNSNSS